MLENLSALNDLDQSLQERGCPPEDQGPSVPDRRSGADGPGIKDPGPRFHARAGPWTVGSGTEGGRQRKQDRQSRLRGCHARGQVAGLNDPGTDILLERSRDETAGGTGLYLEGPRALGESRLSQAQAGRGRGIGDSASGHQPAVVMPERVLERLLTEIADVDHRVKRAVAGPLDVDVDVDGRDPGSGHARGGLQSRLGPREVFTSPHRTASGSGVGCR